MGIGVHQAAILRGSEVANVERAPARAPAAFQEHYGAHKEGGSSLPMQARQCLAFLLFGIIAVALLALLSVEGLIGTWFASGFFLIPWILFE